MNIIYYWLAKDWEKDWKPNVSNYCTYICNSDAPIRDFADIPIAGY